jgi:hypothetical protein
MRAATLLAFALVHAISLRAQITATLDVRPDGVTEIRIKNTSILTLTAFAIGVTYVTPIEKHRESLLIYADPEIDKFPLISSPADPPRAKLPILPDQEFSWLPEFRIPSHHRSPKPSFEQPIAAGIFEDGSVAGNTTLLTQMMQRRRSMLLAIETSFEMLSEAGLRNVPRDQLVRQFRKTADSLNRWYLLSEQQVGIGLYNSIARKLMNLPEGEIGAPFPPSDFVARETAILHQQRVTLLASQPSLADRILSTTR